MTATDIIFATILIFIFAISFFAIYKVVNDASDKMLAMQPLINESGAAIDSLNAGKELTNRLDYIVFGLFIGLCFAIIITGWFVAGHGIFAFIYFTVLIIAIIVSVILNNAYVAFTSTTSYYGTSIFAGIAAHFPITEAIMNNLPIVTCVIGFLGMIAMFAKPVGETR